MPTPTRWASDTEPGHSRWMIEHFAALQAAGQDLAGEARFTDAVIAPRSTVLDAGCGNGRVATALTDRGHLVTGVDADSELIDDARRTNPHLRWILGDLTELDLLLEAEPPFDAALLAGNVMPYLAAGTELAVLRQLAAHVKPDGPVIIGFDTGLGYSLQDFDRHLSLAGLTIEQRFATWDLRPWSPEATFAVTIARLLPIPASADPGPSERMR
ncbi:MAG: class I SAM-dependent methyltransferase [Propionibacteriaceae bacterium]